MLLVNIKLNQKKALSSSQLRRFFSDALLIAMFSSFVFNVIIDTIGFKSTISFIS